MAKFTGKDQKKRLQHSCFPFELHENFKNTFFTEYLLAIASLLDFTFLSIFSHSPFTFRLSVRFAWLLAGKMKWLKLSRSSHPELFCPKGVLKKFTKFTGKRLCQNIFFNKIAGRPSTLLNKRLWHRCFPMNFGKFLRTLYYRTPLVAASSYQRTVILTIVTPSERYSFFLSNQKICVITWSTTL